MDPDKIVLGKTYLCVIGLDEFTSDMVDAKYDYALLFTPTSRVTAGLYAKHNGFEGTDASGDIGIVLAKEFLAEAE